MRILVVAAARKPDLTGLMSVRFSVIEGRVVLAKRYLLDGWWLGILSDALLDAYGMRVDWENIRWDENSRYVYVGSLYMGRITWVDLPGEFEEFVADRKVSS